MTSAPLRCLVTGASGYIGSRLVVALHRAGHEVVATARDVDKLADFDWSGQVLGAAACRQACRGGQTMRHQCLGGGRASLA